jgi:hypothetical protein
MDWKWHIGIEDVQLEAFFGMEIFCSISLFGNFEPIKDLKSDIFNILEKMLAGVLRLDLKTAQTRPSKSNHLCSGPVLKICSWSTRN